MTHYRTRYRQIAHLALTVAPHFAGVKLMSAWVSSVSADDLPAMGIATPRERKDESALDSSDRETTMVIVLKRAGTDDIEDRIDADSLAIEAAILASMRTEGVGAQLDTTTIQIDGQGERRIASLTMEFRLLAFGVPEPITP